MNASTASRTIVLFINELSLPAVTIIHQEFKTLKRDERSGK